MSEPRTWPDLISALLRGQDLTPADTGWAMDAVMSGDAPAVALAGFLVALRAKGESAGEVVGLVDSMLAHAVRVSLPADRGPAVDTCGTGGDRAQTVNISTMAAVVVAAAGATVVKHGNRAASSAAGSADVLEQLGVVIDLPAEAVQSASPSGHRLLLRAPLPPGMRHAATAAARPGRGHRVQRPRAAGEPGAADRTGSRAATTPGWPP